VVATLSDAGIGLMLVLIVAMSVITWLVSSRNATRICQPITALALATRELTAGRLHEDFPLTAPVAGDDEIGELSMSFNAMRVALRENHSALQGSAQQLKEQNTLLHGEIAERRRVEVELQHLATAVDQASDAILITDTDGTIQYVNPAFERISGYGHEEVIGRKPSLLKSGKHDREFYRELWETINRGEVWTGRSINRRKDGSLYEEDSTISPVVDACGKIINFVAVKRDVTERVALEARLRESEKIEVIGRLAGGVAHDFNNLLTVIMGCGQLALDAVGQDHAATHDVEEIRRAADRAASLTRQLLAYSRHQVLEPRVLQLNDVVSNLEKMLERLIGDNIELVVVREPELGRVKADVGQVEQVVMNLVVNGRDAMPRGGELTIETANVSLDPAYARRQADLPPGPYVMLAVSDNGYGIDPETQSRVFEPFFTTKEVGQGTGLGLATVHGIVKQSGGNIVLSSQPGQGTIFKIYLPRVEETAGAGGSTDVPTEQTAGPETVLPAGDERSAQALGRRDLQDGDSAVLDLPGRTG
ncbi:MAG: PAS domain S-box protein, partial [Acidobacteriota bacterium]